MSEGLGLLVLKGMGGVPLNLCRGCDGSEGYDLPLLVQLGRDRAIALPPDEQCAAVGAAPTPGRAVAPSCACPALAGQAAAGHRGDMCYWIRAGLGLCSRQASDPGGATANFWVAVAPPRPAGAGWAWNGAAHRPGVGAWLP